VLFGPFHILHVPFFFFLPNTTAFRDASSFNADISQWDVSRVTRMDYSTSCLANFVDSCLSLMFYFVHFTSYTFFFLFPNTTAFFNAKEFNVDLSKWVVSSVINMYYSTSFSLQSVNVCSFIFLLSFHFFLQFLFQYFHSHSL
jgi:surface protein